ncbi:MAG: AAA family ATPase [Acidaminococcaceae bacterium]|nr:AAA family ATPase [Acidaminococcaceae bacterium]
MKRKSSFKNTKQGRCGENEAGKSTILDAIKIVLNQQYRNADKAVLKDLFNV